jgi:hypothetical protein
MEEDVDDVDEEEQLEAEAEVIFENSPSKQALLKNKSGRRLIIANYIKKTEAEKTAYEEEIRNNRRIRNKSYFENKQKKKRQEAINKKRNALKPFRSSLECRWNQECKFGCGYIHLDRATPSMKSNCCMNGKLSPLQANQFYERYGLLQPLSPGMQDLLINNIEHMGPLSSTYSNVLSIAAIGVENGNKATGVKNTHVGGFEIRGEGAPDCVTMYGRSFHYLTKATDSFHTIEKIGKLFNIFTSIMILIAVIL